MTHKGTSIIFRERLNSIFTEVSQNKVIGVIAPAGYGKTHAVSQWLSNSLRVKAIVHLDEHDNNLVHFCERFCAALSICQPQNNTLKEIVLHPEFANAPVEFSLRAILALSKRKRCVLVIDDLYNITSKEVLKLLSVFLKRLPQNFQIVLLSRNDFPFEISELWLREQLEYITAKELLFSNDEIIELYKKRGINLTAEQAEFVYHSTGGWAIGIKALLLSGKSPSESNIDFLEDIILLSIWDKWDEELREFMLKTANAKELSQSLCSALTGISDVESVMKELMRNGAFIYQTKDGVYHYHKLFRTFLRSRLAEKGDEYSFSLLNKEGEWHLKQRDFFNAANCFIRSKNHDGIASCFDLLKEVSRNDFVLTKMIPIIKDPEVYLAAKGKYPFLFYTMAWFAFAEGRAEDMKSYLDQTFSRYLEIVDRDPEFTHYMFFLYVFDFRKSLSDIIKMTSTLPEKASIKSRGVRAYTIINMPMLHRTTRDLSELATANIAAESALFSGKMMGLLFGQQAGQIAKCIASLLLYEQGRPDDAYSHALTAIADINEHNTPEFRFAMMSALVHILDAMDRANEANKIIEQKRVLIEEYKVYSLDSDFEALTVRRQLANGSIDAARKWLATRSDSYMDTVSLYTIYLTFTTCRAHIVNSEYTAAIILLHKILRLAEAFDRPLDNIEARILLAIAYWKSKRTFQKEAIQYLLEAVTLASKYNYIQMFVNDGAELSSLLRRLYRSAGQTKDKTETLPISFIKMLYLKSLNHPNSGMTSNQKKPVEKYTDKQKTVMKLLCEGKTYNEIAKTMGISHPTVRSHISLIYNKLDVTSGVEAVRKINSQDILRDV